MAEIIDKYPLTDTGRSILRTLLYFDLFSYPLTANELVQFADRDDLTSDTVQSALSWLVGEGIVLEYEGYFSLSEAQDRAERRRKGNAKAERILPLAKRIARFIGAFPFVRGVGLSGSLSKGYMDEETDIDFFIITKPGRLWIARTMLVLFKKVFLLNSYKYFCVNYFLDLDHLQVEEQNRFTALEALTMIPAYGRDTMSDFYAANNWTNDFWPSLEKRQNTAPRSWALSPKRVLEGLFWGQWGHWLDGFFMRKTVRFWSRKFPQLDASTFDLALKSRKYVSKHHPQDFQNKVLQTLRKNTLRLEKRFDISLN